MSKALIIGGSVVGMLGVLLLFMYGMPGRITSSTGAKFIRMEQVNPSDATTDRRYKRRGYLGLALVLAGTALQIWGTAIG